MSARVRLLDDAAARLRARLSDEEEAIRLFSLKVKPRHGGRGKTVECPACNGGDLSVRRGEKNTLQVHCYRCEFGGDVLALAAAVWGRDIKRHFVDVVTDLAARVGLEVVADGTSYEKRSSTSAKPKLEPVVAQASQPSSDEGVDDAVFAAAIRPLEHLGRLDGGSLSGPVCEYLEGRGLLGAARADGWFAVGSDAGEMLCDVFGAELVQRCGLVLPSGRLKWSEHALAIPWRTPEGIVQTIQRRHLGVCDEKTRYVFPKDRGPAWPYGIERLAPSATIAITEGAVDVLARRPIDAAAERVTLGAPGVSGWRRAWDEFVRGRTVVIAFDADGPGDEQAAVLAARFYEAGAERVQRATPTRGKDWAEAMQVQA